MSAFTKQFALFGETAAMAFDTIRSNKMRSALTVLGVVIGVTSIVGMTSLIRGFDSSLRDSINTLGPNTVYVQRFGGLSFSSGASFMELMRRPLVTSDDMYAIERNAASNGCQSAGGPTRIAAPRIGFAPSACKRSASPCACSVVRVSTMRRPRNGCSVDSQSGITIQPCQRTTKEQRTPRFIILASGWLRNHNALYNLYFY